MCKSLDCGPNHKMKSVHKDILSRQERLQVEISLYVLRICLRRISFFLKQTLDSILVYPPVCRVGFRQRTNFDTVLGIADDVW